MTTLDNFLTKNQRAELKAAAKEKRKSKLKQFYMKWNLTQESLTDRYGNKSTDNIVKKAMAFLEHESVRKMINQPGGPREYWVCEPIPNYNVTTYTMWYYIDNDMVVCACNCQYCKTKGRMCSHVLAMLIANKIHLLKRWVKGDGVRNYKPLRKDKKQL